MATYVQDTLGKVDAAIAGYAQSVFATLAGPIATTCQLVGLVGLALIALNTLLQWVPIRVSEYIRWGVRFVVVTAVATSWTQFQPIYDVLTNTPGAIGAELMGATMAPNLNVAFDLMISELFAFSDKLADESGFLTISMTSVVVWIMGGLMAVAAIIIASLAKVGLAMAVSLAPVFIPTLMFKATGNLFEGWVRFTLGFALIPLVLAGVMGAIIGIGTGMTSQASSASDLSDAAGFIIVGAAAIFLMIQVPTLVNGLAGTIVATANGVAMARGGAGAGASVAGGVKTLAAPHVGAAMSAVGAARAASGTGQSASQAMMADLQASYGARKRFAMKHARHSAERGEQAGAFDRFAAANAGQRVQARENAATRATRPTKASAELPDAAPPTRPRKAD